MKASEIIELIQFKSDLEKRIIEQKRNLFSCTSCKSSALKEIS